MLKANHFNIKSYSKNIQLDQNNNYFENYNFDKIVCKINSQKNKEKSISESMKNEYYCNLLISSSNPIPLIKLEYYDLLFSFNTNQEDKKYKYFIFQKINKYLDFLKQKEKKEDFSQFNEIMMEQIEFLENEKNYFYCYNLLSNKLYNYPKEIEKIKAKLAKKLVSWIEEKQKFFENISPDELVKITEILKNIRDNKNTFDITETLFAVNNLWVNKAIAFLNNFSKIIINEKEKKNRIKQMFNVYQTYNSFFNQNEKKDIYYPGPIDNYYISDFKNIWNDPLSEDENDMIKNGLSLGKDYVLMKEKDWMIIKEIFGSTNEIKRKINNLELLAIKAIVFDKRIIKNDITFLKQKFFQIGKNTTIQEFKEKILRCFINSLESKNEKEEKQEIVKKEINIKDKTNINDKKIENRENKDANNITNNSNINNYINENKEIKISFYKLSKKKRQILIEIFTSFINDIPTYKSNIIENIDLKDDNPLESLFNNYDKSSDILLIEIINQKSPQFLSQIQKTEKNLYQCSVCEKKIPLENKYNCKLCHMSFFCSKNCSQSQINLSHIKLHEYLKEFRTQKFDINEFLKSKLDSRNFNDGLVGLKNLGNTCFINSSLQCLFNTNDLSKYFLSNYFMDEINKKNTLGYNGIIAESYAEFLNEMKTTINSVLNPIDFIKTFFRNNKSLNLRGQQDAQEFLSILLDSLHEDLNRITSKPYIELEEQKENENDFEASTRWWDCYKKREDSIIIDLFHGQFKSKITCLDCKKTSITYDPFIFLGLPIPNKREQTIIKFFFGDKLEFLGIDINEKTTIKDLIKKGIELMRMNNYKDELSDDDLYGIIEIVQIDKYKIVRKICNANNKIHQFDPLCVLLKNEENLEIVLYEKNIDEKYFNIYVYPIKGEEYDNSSYPMALSVRPEMTFNKIVEENEDKIRSMYTNLHKNDIIIFGLVHRINDNWLYYFSNGFDSKEECPFCKSNGNFCIIQDNYKISQLLQIIKNKKPDYGEALFTIGNKKKNVINKIIKTDKYFNNGVFFLSDCLKLFCEEEMLNQDNLWYCNKCKKHKIAKKQIRLYKLPMYLIIQLKKFKNSSGFFSSSNEKKEAYIKYPINNLDLSEYIGEKGGNKEKYDLYAVIQHHGQISQGHYTAICKINNKWVLFNDDKYYLINNPINKDAYLLFYKKNKT